jgi:hypothetical protein
MHDFVRGVNAEDLRVSTIELDDRETLFLKTVASFNKGPRIS